MAQPTSPFKNYYEVLRVRPYDSPELIRASFLAQMKRWHPDRFHNSDADLRRSADQRAKLLNEAREHLLDAACKAEYDALFAARFPRRFEKLSTRERPKSREPVITPEGLAEPALAPYARNPYEPFTFRWMDFACRIRPRTGCVIFNLSHFLDRNPDCEVRLRLAHNMDWTPFSRQRVYTAQYHSDVALVEMQGRYVSPKGRMKFSKPVRKTIIVTKFAAAMQERERILSRQRAQCNRIAAMKILIAVVGGVCLCLNVYGQFDFLNPLLLTLT